MAGAYHGHTKAIIDLSPYKYDGPGGEGQQPHIHVLPCPDPYRWAPVHVPGNILLFLGSWLSLKAVRNCHISTKVRPVATLADPVLQDARFQVLKVTATGLTCSESV